MGFAQSASLYMNYYQLKTLTYSYAKKPSLTLLCPLVKFSHPATMSIGKIALAIVGESASQCVILLLSVSAQNLTQIWN